MINSANPSGEPGEAHSAFNPGSEWLRCNAPRGPELCRRSPPSTTVTGLSTLADAATMFDRVRCSSTKTIQAGVWVDGIARDW